MLKDVPGVEAEGDGVGVRRKGSSCKSGAGDWERPSATCRGSSWRPEKDGSGSKGWTWDVAKAKSIKKLKENLTIAPNIIYIAEICWTRQRVWWYLQNINSVSVRIPFLHHLEVDVSCARHIFQLQKAGRLDLFHSLLLNLTKEECSFIE